MEDLSIKLTRLDAVKLHNCISAMPGSPSFQLLRKGITEKIIKVWPEIAVADAPTDAPADLQETRSMKVTPREQRALAEGFVGIFNKKDQAGEHVLTLTEFSYIESIVKLCKMWGWVKGKIEQEEVADFDEPLDDAVLDEVTADE